MRKLPEDLVASVQASRILQVLANLIANALDAMLEKGKLTVGVKKCSGCVELTVADNGADIGPATMEKLFKPFFSTKVGGTGVGLSLSKRIVEDHGGKIFVRSSVLPGRNGSIFRVRLPDNPIVGNA